ncbi:MAG: tyrosine-type recombinase/integrase [Candidatus Delongbacteria bacterium]|nr:tyrosine-type recombinase/integrase [Candidatus Delongbacteria bacterium]
MSYNTNTRIVLKNVNADKIGTIFIEIAFHHKMTKDKVRRYISTGQRLHSEDITKGKIKQADRTKKIRDIVEKKMVEVKEKLRTLELVHDEISPYIYDQSHVSNEFARLTVMELFDEFLKYQEAEHEPLTVKKHKTLQQLLIEYKTSKKITTLHVDDLDGKFFKEFTTFLKRTKKHAPLTVNKYQSCLKAFMQYLTDELDLNPSAIHKTFKKESRKKSGGAKVVLLKEHIEKLLNWETDNKRYDLVRDLFLFQVFTGIRYSDLENIGKSHVINNHLVFTMYKVNKGVSIPLHVEAVRILKKYNYELGEQVKTLQNYNKDIKHVCKEAGLADTIKSLKIVLSKKVKDDDQLWTLVSSHVGRSSFITNCLISGIPPHIVMAFTGHSKLETLSEYMQIAGNMTADAFKRFEQHLTF